MRIIRCQCSVLLLCTRCTGAAVYPRNTFMCCGSHFVENLPDEPWDQVSSLPATSPAARQQQSSLGVTSSSCRKQEGPFRLCKQLFPSSATNKASQFASQALLCNSEQSRAGRAFSPLEDSGGSLPLERWQETDHSAGQHDISGTTQTLLRKPLGAGAGDSSPHGEQRG